MSKGTWIGVGIIVLIIAGLAYLLFTSNTVSSSVPLETDATAASSTAATADNLTLGINGTSTSAYLIGFNGMALYVYSADSSGTPTCYDTCAETFPPYTISQGSSVNVEAGVNGSAGTVSRTDGSLQVTYNGAPLYFYTGDTTGDDTNGTSVSGWQLARP